MFFEKKSPIKFNDLVKIIGAKADNIDAFINDVCALDNISDGLLACYHNSKYKNNLINAKSGFCILSSKDASLLPKGVIGIFSETPYRDFGKVVSYFYPRPVSNGVIASNAFIHENAKIGSNCQISPFAVIESGAEIGEGSIISSHCLVGSNVKIGANSVLESNVTITNTIAGDRLYVKPGARIGQQGFGFYMDEKGHFDIPQVGSVIIGNDVQIGANVTIDRGSQHDTKIGNFCRIDNLVQIAHNVELGDGCVLVAQAGVAGSTKLGKFVIVAGQVGIAGHLNIDDGVKIAAQSGVIRNIGKGETVAGYPAVNVRDWHKQTIALQRLSKK